MKKNVLRAILFILILCLFTGTVNTFAAVDSYVPYNTYEYNSNGESVKAPVGYYPDMDIYSADMNLELPLTEPSDIYYNGSESVYIMDSGNGRIIELGLDFKVKRIIDKFILPADLSTSGTEEVLKITGAQGFTISQNMTFYIADTKNQRILFVDNNGVVKKVIEKSMIDLIKSDALFDVSKIAIGYEDKIYVIATSINNGILVFDQNGKFIKFFGSNPIEVTADVLLKYIKKKFMSKEQWQRTYQYTPINLRNFDIDKNGFIYTVTAEGKYDISQGSVKKFNYLGNDILNTPKAKTFGDIETDREIMQTNATKLIDVDMDSEGFINLLDLSRGRVFQYEPDEGKMIAVFGSIGTQMGTMSTPSAIESIGDKIYVLDSAKNCIHVYAPTEYIKAYRNAFIKLKKGELANSEKMWQELLKYNTNNQYTYYGLGKVYDEMGRYKEAMTCFEIAKIQTDYSISFKEYRKEYIKQYVMFIILGLILLISFIALGIYMLRKLLVAKNDSAYTVMEMKGLMPFYITMHPVEGFGQFKYRAVQSYLVSFIIVGFWFLLNVGKSFFTGFIFRAGSFDLFQTLVQTIGLFALFVIANWAICTLSEGKGKLSEIVAVVSYSMIPYLISTVIYIMLSNMLTINESAFLSIIIGLGQIWTGILLFCGLYAIHQYTVLKTVLSITLTLAAMAVMIVLIILLYGLMSQAIGFIQLVIQEISLR